jgi:hypothetical protein
MRGNRISVVLSATALAVALLGTTPFGRAATGALDAVNSANPLALDKKRKKKAKPKLIRGPRGAHGPQGPQGPAGPAGAPGAKGDAGAPGAAGTPGAAGAPGAPGAKGEKGDGFRWLGAQTDADYCNKIYQPGDVVAFDGSAWIATTGIGGCVPPPHAPWQLMARKGEQGPQGTQGPQGPAGISGYEVIAGDLVRGIVGTGFNLTLGCPAGKRALGGGFVGRDVDIASSAPAPAGIAWQIAGGFRPSATSPQIQPWVICATVS